jgi:hypothetical protein
VGVGSGVGVLVGSGVGVSVGIGVGVDVSVGGKVGVLVGVLVTVGSVTTFRSCLGVLVGVGVIWKAVKGPQANNGRIMPIKMMWIKPEYFTMQTQFL